MEFTAFYFLTFNTMHRHNNKTSTDNNRNNRPGNIDAASNSNRIISRNPRIFMEDEREKIRYTQKNIFRLNDLYERGSI